MTSNPKNYFFQKLYEKYYDAAPYIHDNETISDYRERIRRIELTTRAWRNKQGESKIENFIPFEVVTPVIDDSLGDSDWDYKRGRRLKEKYPIPDLTGILTQQQPQKTFAQHSPVIYNILRFLSLIP